MKIWSEIRSWWDIVKEWLSLLWSMVGLMLVILCVLWTMFSVVSIAKMVRDVQDGTYSPASRTIEIPEGAHVEVYIRPD